MQFPDFARVISPMLRIKAAVAALAVLSACDGRTHDCTTPGGVVADGVDCAVLGALEARAVEEFGTVWPAAQIRAALPGIAIHPAPADWLEPLPGGSMGMRAAGGGLYYGLTFGADIWVADPADQNAIAHELAHAIQGRIEHVSNPAHDGWQSRGIVGAIGRVAPFPR